MMKINVSGWKKFRIGELFDVVPTKGVNTYGIEDDGDTPYIAASRENNGCSCFVSCDSDWVSQGNCLVFVHIGDAAAGVCHYVDKDFVGMKGKTSCAYNKHINEYTGLFLASVITANNASKYSFSESWTGKGLLETEIMLPATPDGDPDWAYMESYMKGVMDHEEVFASHLASLTAEAVADGHVIDTSGWKAFRVVDLGFFIYHGQRLNKAQRIDGETPFITAGFENRGVTQYIGNDRPMYHKAITVDMFGNCFFQPEDCAGDDNVYFFVNDDVSDLAKLFISSGIGAMTSAKFDYARQFRQGDADNLEVMLPATLDGDPDWAFMEVYMKSVMEREAMFAEELDKLIA